MQHLQRITLWSATRFHISPILFSIFINDLFLWLRTADLHNLANNNTISAFSKDLEELIKKNLKHIRMWIKWFTNNCMILNPSKFQSNIESSKGKIKPRSLKINSDSIKTSKSVKLLDIEIDSHLNFEWYVSTIWKKDPGQLNALSRLKSFLNQDQRNIITVYIAILIIAYNLVFLSPKINE